MFQTSGNSQLLRRVLWINAELTIVWSLKHQNTKPIYIFNRVRVLHLDRLKEGTWLHSFVFYDEKLSKKHKVVNFYYCLKQGGAYFVSWRISRSKAFWSGISNFISTLMFYRDLFSTLFCWVLFFLLLFTQSWVLREKWWLESQL